LSLLLLSFVFGCGSGGSSPASAAASDPAPATGSTTSSAPAAPPSHFVTEASGATFLPRSDSYCASAITPTTAESRPDNDQANGTVVTPQWVNDSENGYPLWVTKRNQVTGNFTGSTTEILRWAACKWGIDEDLIRADAVQESKWHQSAVSDNCGVPGEASYGILQIKNLDCSGAPIHGGYPQTQQSTALNADWWAAHIRSCYDGDFQGLLYNGQTPAQIAATSGWDDVLWGCVGFHFSGNWNPAQQYVQQVQQILAGKPWLQPGF